MMIRFLPLAALSLALLAGGCSTSKDPDALAQNDPYEATNRDVFDFDIKLDKAVLLPAAKFYRSAVPGVARDGIHNAIANLNAPVLFANDVFQLDGDKASNTLGRFMLNSTVGMAGLVDVAAKAGMPAHANDFGITLGKAGASEGSYLVLPFLGPKPPRDLAGTAVDAVMDPLNYIGPGGFINGYQIAKGGLDVLDTRAANIERLDSIERSSIDFYATTRSLYRQYRNAQINEGKADEFGDLPNF
jgi:phospholipid-binding lipoprotein MlaA